MKSVRFRILALAVAAFTLAGCEAKANSGSAKSNLESAGYSVKVVAAAEYQTPSAWSETTKPEGLVDYLEAAKSPKDGLFAWYFENIDKCTTWFSANQVNLVGKKILDNELSPTQYNNVVYVATADAKAAAKIS